MARIYIISKSSKQAADGTGSSQQPTQPSFRKSGVYAAGIWVRETIGWWEMEGEEHSEVNQSHPTKCSSSVDCIGPFLFQESHEF